MNVKFPAPTIADASAFIMYSGHPFFQNAEATVHFMRTIDRLSDILNVKNLYGKGFKQPLKSCNQIIWGELKVEYLLTLKTIDGTPLIIHRRKTFAVGFITTNSSTKMIALELMENDDFQYYLAYMYSQDLLELLLACMRGNDGFNNNQNLRTFKAALKRTLIRTSIIASKHANCILFEEQASNSIFLLKWTKNCTPLEQKANSSNLSENSCVQDLTAISYLSSLFQYEILILAYIGGCIIGVLSKSLLCKTFCNAFVKNQCGLLHL